MPPLAFIGGIRGLIGAAIAAVIVWSALTLYDRVWDDPAIAAAARRDFVAKAELEAEKARNAELIRQIDAGNAALETARQLAEADAIADAETARRTEQEIAVMEARLAAEGRSCKLSEDDISDLSRR